MSSVARLWLTRNWKEIGILLLTGLFAGWFFWTSCIQAGVSDAQSDDLAHVWQTVWNVAHGHGFTYTHVPMEINVSRLSTHTDYILILLAPLARIWPNYQVLLLAQAIIVAAGIWLVWRIGRRLIGDDLLAGAMAIAYAFYGPLQFALSFQFHAVTLATTFMLGMIEAIISRRRLRWVWLWFALALLTKEQVGIIAGLIALIIFWRQKMARWGWIFLTTGVLYATIQFLIIIPAFRPTGDPHLLWQFYYGSLGNTPTEIIPKLIQPHELWTRLVTPLHGQNILFLLLPLGGLPLLDPITLIGALALLPHWLADDFSVNSLYFQNHILAIPPLVVGALYTLKRGMKLQFGKRSRVYIAAGLIFLASIGSVIFSPNPWSVKAYSSWGIHNFNLPALAKINRDIPVNAVVAYSWGLPPIFRNRETVYLLPYGYDQADYIVVERGHNRRLNDWVKTYYDDLFNYFNDNPAFRTIAKDADYAVYQRIPRIAPAPWPTGFKDPTPHALQGFGPRVMM